MRVRYGETDDEPRTTTCDRSLHGSAMLQNCLLMAISQPASRRHIYCITIFSSILHLHL